MVSTVINKILQQLATYELQGSHSCDEAKFKGFSRIFSNGHNKNLRFIYYLEKLKTKKIEEKKITQGQVGKFKGAFFQALIKGVVKSQVFFPRNQGRVRTL